MTGGLGLDAARLRRRIDVAVLPLLGFLAVFFVGPLVAVLAIAFLAFDARTFTSAGLTLEHINRFAFDGFYRDALLRTFGIAAATTAIALIFAYPVAWHLYTMRQARARTFLVLIVLLPVMVSFVVTAFAWVVILGGNGLVNQVLLGAGLVDRPVKLLSTNTGVILVLTYTFVPFMIMNIYAALETIDPVLLHSASVLGAPPRQVFRHVVFPMSLPGVLSGSLLVFSLALGAFVSPVIIGGSQVKTVPVLIFNFATGVFDWPGAAALSVLFLVASLTVTWFLSRAFQRRFLRWLRPVLMRALVNVAAWLAYALLVIPIAVVVASSFTESSYIVFPPKGSTLRWYGEIGSDSALMSGVALSLQVAAVTAFTAGLLGTSGALFLARSHGRVRDLAQAFFLTPLTIPNVVIGLSLLIVFSRVGLVSFIGLAIGHTIVTIPYVVRTVLSSLLNSDRQLPKAAAVLGARPWQVFWHVTLPIVRPGLLASAVFAFLVSFNNITISIFVAAPGTATLPVVLFNKVAYVPEPTVVAVSALMVAMTVAILLVLDRSLSLFRSMFR